MVGASSTIILVNDLMENKSLLDSHQIMCLPGGFSFGDELGSGQILAHKIKFGLKEEFYKFVDSKKAIIGICNGFQVLTKLGLLPNYKEERSVALAHNNSKTFIDCWVDLKVDQDSKCLWTKGLEEISLPIRHGEGRVCFSKNHEQEIFQSLKDNGQIPLYYKENPNGSAYDIAGICDPSGLIFGLMPHHEAAVSPFSHAVGNGSMREQGAGLNIFKNIMEIF